MRCSEQGTERRAADMPSAVRVRALANELATLQAGREVNVGKELVMPSADRGGAEGCEPAPSEAAAVRLQQLGCSEAAASRLRRFHSEATVRLQ